MPKNWGSVFVKLAPLVQMLKDSPDLHEQLSQLDPEAYEEICRLAKAPFFSWEPFGTPGTAEKPGTCQVGFLESRAHEKWGQAGNRAGKTVVGLAEDLADLLHLDILTKGPSKRFPTGSVHLWVVSDTEETSINIVQRTLVEQFFGEDEAGVMWNLVDDVSKWNQISGWKDHMLQLVNGSWIQFRFSTQKRNTFQGMPLHVIHHDEVQPEDIYDECKARLTDYHGYFRGTMTPVFDEKKGIPWIHEKLYLRRVEKEIDFIRWSMLDNPYLSVASKKAYMKTLDADEIDARIHGRYVPVGVKLAFAARLLDRIRPDVRHPKVGDLTYDEDGNVEFLPDEHRDGPEAGVQTAVRKPRWDGSELRALREQKRHRRAELREARLSRENVEVLQPDEVSQSDRHS